MNIENLVKKIYDTVVVENNKIYNDSFKEADIDDIENSKSAYWKYAVKMFYNLNDEEKTIFFKILKQVQIDTVSNMLGLIDGSSSFSSGGTLDVEMRFEDNAEILNGYLQDIFLEIVESKREN